MIQSERKKIYRQLSEVVDTIEDAMSKCEDDDADLIEYDKLHTRLLGTMVLALRLALRKD